MDDVNWDAKRWAEAKRDLAAYCTTSKPVHVRRSKMDADAYGDCHDAGSSYVIRIRSDLDIGMALEVLAHEYAHVMAWHLPGHRRASHDALWGVCYAQCYVAAYQTT